MKSLAILGSTGSIGLNVLHVVSAFPRRYRVTALCASTSVERLAGQIREFRPRLAVVRDAEHADRLRELLAPGVSVDILHGDSGYIQAAVHPDVQTVVGAMVGAAGLVPTLQAIEAGKQVALANKETLVMAGQLVMDRAREKNVSISPIDSEHSAIFQCLAGSRRQDLDRILLTGSGGPFRTRSKESFGDIDVAQALRHPNWSMGKKITIDSATLMNKGLEVIEAKWLFGVSLDQIEVLIHPQSIVHSMVAFQDGSVMAQLGIPDMKGAIAYALSHPERLALNQPLPDFAAMGALTFEKPDLEKFPCLSLAFEACRRQGTLPAVLNAANEMAVAAFLEESIGFTQIAEVISTVMQRHASIDNPDLSAILEADRWARRQAQEEINFLK